MGLSLRGIAKLECGQFCTRCSEAILSYLLPSETDSGKNIDKLLVYLCNYYIYASHCACVALPSVDV